MKNNDVKFTLPMLAEPRTVRIRFRKVGNLQYISHLDLQRTFNRVLVRAGLPLWYTKGFNPHIKMVFGMPLPVGSESECEMLDVRIERDMSLDEIKERLNRELTDELRRLTTGPDEPIIAIDQEGGREAIESRGIPVFPMFTRATIFGDK